MKTTKLYITNIRSEYLLKYISDCVIVFPEVKNGYPLTPKEILESCASLMGKTIITVSEHIVLYFMKQVRDGVISCEELNIYYVGETVQYMEVDSEGDFVDSVPNGFFGERADLLF